VDVLAAHRKNREKPWLLPISNALKIKTNRHVALYHFRFTDHSFNYNTCRAKNGRMH
jgi:hypothetical protein